MRPLVAALFLLTTIRAEAAVTADEVWADWQRLAATAGAPITAVARREGARLVLSRLRLALGSDSDPASLGLDEVVLQDNPDGTVSVILPERFPVTLDLPASPVVTDPDVLTFDTFAPGLLISVAGLGEAAAFVVTAPSLTVTLSPLTLPPGAAETLSLTLAAADLSLAHKQDFVSPDKTLHSGFRIETLHADVSVSLPGDEGGSLTVDLATLMGHLSVFGPASLAGAGAGPEVDFFTALGDGMALSFELSHGALTVTGDVVERAAPVVSFRLTSASGTASTRLDQEGFAYAVTSGATRLDATLNDPEVPFAKLGVGYGESGLGLSFDLAPTSDPQDFASFLRLGDLTLDDGLWAEIDPTGTFPHDPMSVAIALSGTAAIRPEALEPGWKPRSEGDLPLDIWSLSIDELGLSGLGAALTGTGALDFDNSDRVTFDGLPAPTGMLRFAATGVNGLIDRMARANLISPDELMPLRFGLAFIAKPGDGPDTLTSTVEFRDKSLVLNGIKLR